MSIELVFTLLIAAYLAFNLGANDVANSMGTSVGSGAVSLKKALVIAGVLEFTGAVLFGKEVSGTLATKIANPAVFQGHPELLALGMLVVLISGSLWLQIATFKNLPVASSHAIVGGIAGVSWVAAGVGAVAWQQIGIISIAWLVTPLVSGTIAAGFYLFIKKAILDSDDRLTSLKKNIPWLALSLTGIFGTIVLPAIIPDTFQISGDRSASLSLNKLTISSAIIGITALLLAFNNRRSLESTAADSESAEKLTERIFGRFQLLSACGVAFAHGANDVGNAIAPVAAILYIDRTGTVPIDNLDIPLWLLVIGGVGIVAGLAILGKNVIETIGSGIIELQPSKGFAAELATATTILIASRFGLPVSTSHALVGSVVGIGIANNWREVRLDTLKSIGTAWIVTIPICAGLAAIFYNIAKYLMS
jgi:inorganic phosphate transporter, PiT family